MSYTVSGVESFARAPVKGDSVGILLWKADRRWIKELLDEGYSLYLVAKP